MEHQLQRVPQANQIEVAQDDGRPQGQGFVLLQSRVEEIQMALWTEREEMTTQLAFSLWRVIRMVAYFYLTDAADECPKKCHDIPYTFVIILGVVKRTAFIYFTDNSE